MMLLREFNSLQGTAGISGIQGALKNKSCILGRGYICTSVVAFLASSFRRCLREQLHLPENYEALQKLSCFHDGAAKIGDFIIEQTGRIVMVDPL